MDKIEAFPNMESGYKLCQRLFCDVLGRLARQGLVWPPADTEDLVQDFIADAWTGLTARYDPAFGSAVGYIYGAIVRFARQRILRLQKWQPRLRDMAGLADHVAAPEGLSPLDSLVHSEQVGLIEAALAELPPQRRTILLDYFASGPRSQRQLAHKYGMTRYQLHEVLINGFGQLTARLASRAAWPLPDRDVAFALWCEGWDLDEAARRLGRSVQQIREARTRLARRHAEQSGGWP
jgi:RNA polymerase sigma factor (sigma-70 family)